MLHVTHSIYVILSNRQLIELVAPALCSTTIPLTAFFQLGAVDFASNDGQCLLTQMQLVAFDCLAKTENGK